MNIEPLIGHSSSATHSGVNADALKQNPLNNSTLENFNTLDTASTPVRSLSSTEDIAACLDIVRNALADVKAQNVVEIDVHGISNVSDMLVIASGTSTRHVKALANNVFEDCKKAGFRPIGMEGERDAEWILVDFGLVVVHVMLPTARTFYDLESLWKPKA